MPIKDWKILESRTEVKMIEEKILIEKGTNLTNRIEKIEYEYCPCDFCLGRVIVKDYENYKKNGAIIKYRNPIGRKFPIALHSKCLKDALKDISEYYEKKEKTYGEKRT